MENCLIEPMGEYGKPYTWILSGCEWCEFSEECFLIAERDYKEELLARENFAGRCYTIKEKEE